MWKLRVWTPMVAKAGRSPRTCIKLREVARTELQTRRGRRRNCSDDRAGASHANPLRGSWKRSWALLNLLMTTIFTKTYALQRPPVWGDIPYGTRPADGVALPRRAAATTQSHVQRSRPRKHAANAYEKRLNDLEEMLQRTIGIGEHEALVGGGGRCGAVVLRRSNVASQTCTIGSKILIVHESTELRVIVKEPFACSASESL